MRSEVSAPKLPYAFKFKRKKDLNSNQLKYLRHGSLYLPVDINWDEFPGVSSDRELLCPGPELQFHRSIVPVFHPSCKFSWHPFFYFLFYLFGLDHYCAVNPFTFVNHTGITFNPCAVTTLPLVFRLRSNISIWNDSLNLK